MSLSIPSSSLWSCSATVLASLNPSFTIITVSSDWTEVVVADVVLEGEEHMVFPMLFIILLTEEHCTVLHEKDHLSLTTSPHWIISDLF